MSEQENNGAERSEAAVFQSMTLLATLQTAMDVWEAVAQRRAGRDPSAQEPPEVARPYLRSAGRALLRLHQQLLAAHILGPRTDEDSSLAATVRHFDQLTKLQRAERLLHGAHQRLLSLYPEVDEEFVETARRLHAACEAFPDAEEHTFREHLPAFLERLERFAGRLERV